MGFTKGNVIERPLHKDQGYLRYAESWKTDGIGNIWMDFILGGLSANVIDGKVAVANSAGTVLQSFTAATPPNEFHNIPMHVVITADQLPDAPSPQYGQWEARISLRLTTGGGTFGWIYDGAFTFNVLYEPPIIQPPPPPPPDNPCDHCGPGTHCENGICVPDPLPPSWIEKLKALFPPNLQAYAIPISAGAAYLAFKGVKKK